MILSFCVYKISVCIILSFCVFKITVCVQPVNITGIPPSDRPGEQPKSHRSVDLTHQNTQPLNQAGQKKQIPTANRNYVNYRTTNQPSANQNIPKNIKQTKQSPANQNTLCQPLSNQSPINQAIRRDHNWTRCIAPR